MGNQPSASRTQIEKKDTRPTIGLLIDRLDQGYLAGVWAGAMALAQEKDANLICFVGGVLESPFEFEVQHNVLYDLVNAENVDGLVIAGTLGHYVNLDVFRDFCGRYRSLPVVTIGITVEGNPGVLVDNDRGMRDALVHLIKSHGYHRIAFIRGPEGQQEADRRYHIYTEMLAQHDIPLDHELVAPGNFSLPSGREAIQLLVDQRQVAFDAVMAANDLMALGALEALQARGMRVPNEVAVVGFDDVPEAWVVTPPLTTVQQPLNELGWRAAEMVLVQLQGKPVPQQIVLPTQMVVRQSCGCPSLVATRATAGPVTVIDETLENFVLNRREKILSEMVRAMHSSREEADLGWARQLLDALLSEFTEEADGVLLSTLDRILRQAIGTGDDVSVWQNAISVLRRQTLPYLRGEARFRAEDLWGQASVMIGEAAQRFQAYQRFQAEQRDQMLRNFGQALITTFDVNELLDVLIEGLSQLGIPCCYLALYEDPEVPTELSRLILAYDDQGQVTLQAGGLRFPSLQLVPEEMLPAEKRYNLIVEPLYFRADQLGFIIFEVGPRGTVYEALRGEISSALQGALLVDRRRQAEAAMTKRATELTLVVQVGATASTILDTGELLERVANLTKDSFGLYHAHIYLLDEAGETLVLAAGAGAVGEQMVAERWRIPVDQGNSLVTRAVRMHQGVIVNDVLTDPDWLPNPLLPDTRSELAVPLLVGERLLGVLDVQANEVGHFTEDDVRILSTLAAQVAVALENARLFEQEQENLTLTERLYQAAQRITAASDLPGIVTAVAEVVPEGVVDRLVLCDFEYGEADVLTDVVVRANWYKGQGKPLMSVGTRYQRIAYPEIRQFQNSEPVIFGNVQHDARFDETLQAEFRRLDIQAMAVLPLSVGSRHMGALLLQTGTGQSLSEEDIRPYVSLMSQAAVAIENQRLLAEMNAALAAVETTQRHYTMQTWQAYWARHGGGMTYEEVREAVGSPHDALSLVKAHPSAEGREGSSSAFSSTSGGETEELLSGQDDENGQQRMPEKVQSNLVVPLTVRDELVGELGLQVRDDRMWTPEEVAIVETIGEQLTLAMENLRLIDESQQRVAREARINEISEKIQGAQSLEEALQIAVREVGLSLKAPLTTVQVNMSE